VALTAEDAARVAAVTGGVLPEVVAVPAAVGSLRCLAFGRVDDPPVLLVHGNGGHALWWAPLVPALVPGWRAIALDLRGHGASAHASPPAYRIEDFASDLDAVVAALGLGPLPVVGHSMGGRVALWWTARRPDAVRALGLLDTRFDPVDAETAAQYRGRVAGRREGRRYPTRDAAVAAFRFVPDEPDVPAAVVAMLASYAVAPCADGDGWTFRFDRAVLSIDGDGGGDLHRLLPAVRCPTWVAAGADSWVCTPAHRGRIAAALPRCTTAAFPGAHHFLVARGAAVGAALRGFLDGLPPAAPRR